jgi:hypothetical protein
LDTGCHLTTGEESQLANEANRGVRERTEEAEGICNPIGRTTISTNQYTPPFPPDLPGIKPPTKEYTWLQLHM